MAESLERRLLTGSLWAIFDGWANQLATLVIYVVLARLLTPTEFGIVTLAGIFTTLASNVLIYGVAQVVIQKPDLEPADCDAVFWVTVTLSLLSALLLCLAAPAVAALFGAPEIAPVLMWLSLAMVLHGCTAVHLDLLTRELRFDLTARRSLVMNLGGGLVGIAMALGGWQVWSLVGQNVVGALLSVAMLLPMTPWRPGVRARRRHFAGVWRFIASAIGNQLLAVVDERGAPFAIGLVFGPAVTGIFGAASRLIEIVTRLFVFPLSQIAMPGFAHLRDEPGRIAALLRQANAVGVLASAPAFVGLAILAPQIVELLLGSQWVAAAPVLQALALRGLALPALVNGQALLYGLGRPERMLVVNLVDIALHLVLLVAVAPLGPVAVAAAITLRLFLIRWPLLARETAALGGVGFAEQVRQILPATLAAGGMALLLAGLLAILPAGLPGPVALAVAVPAGAFAYAAIALLTNRTLVLESIARLIGLLRPTGMQVP